MVLSRKIQKPLVMTFFLAFICSSLAAIIIKTLVDLHVIKVLNSDLIFKILASKDLLAQSSDLLRNLDGILKPTDFNTIINGLVLTAFISLVVCIAFKCNIFELNSVSEIEKTNNLA